MTRLRVPRAKTKPRDYTKLPWTELFRCEYPTRKAKELIESGIKLEDLRDYLFADLRMDYRKANLLVEAYKNESGIVKNDNEILLTISTPICENQCIMCDRNIFRRTNKNFKKYFNCLKQEVKATREIILKRGFFVKSVCLTGNALVFSAEQLDELLGLCTYTLNEICIELSDAKLVTNEKLDVLKKYPNIRFIFNALTFNMITSRLLNKHFEANKVKDYVKKIVDYGFDISVRLAVGICGESDLKLSRSLKFALEVGASCIDLYALTCPKLKNKEIASEDRYPEIRKINDYAYEFLIEQKYSPYFLYLTDV